MPTEATTLDVREASVEDAGIMASIIRSAFEEHVKAGFSPGAMSEGPDFIAEALETGEEKGVVCYVDGKPAGTARFYLKDGLYFRRLGVHPDFRGMGVAREIISWIEEYAVSIGENKVYCNTNAAWGKNVRFYRDMGYSITNERDIDKNGRIVHVLTFTKLL